MKQINFTILFPLLWGFIQAISYNGYFSLSTADSILLRNLSLTQSPLAVNVQNLFNLVYDEDIFTYAEPLNAGNNLRLAQEQEKESVKKEVHYFHVYPNPTDGGNIIEAFAGGINTVIRITDVQGRMVFTGKIAKEQNKMELGNDVLQPGLYFVSLYSVGKRIETVKLVKTQ